MKKYETLMIQINECADVVATSAEVTTEKILFPWSGAASTTSDSGVQGGVDSNLYQGTN